jgi:hypothetical protein
MRSRDCDVVLKGCAVGLGKSRGGQEIGMGRKWGGNGEWEVSLRATWDQGGRDRTTQEEGFQVSEKGIWQGELTWEISKGSKKGIAPQSSTANLCMCIK